MEIKMNSATCNRNNWRRSTIAIALAMLIIFLVACKTKEERLLKTDIHEGTDGLQMGFVSNMPPDDITDKVTFQIGIELRNLGTHTIEKGYVTLLNFYPEEMVLKDQSKTKVFGIEGKNIYNGEGGYDLVTYTLENKGLPIKEKKESTFLFKAFACYLYRTSASVDVCIVPRTFGPVNLKGHCELEDLGIGDGQGAPVAITKVEQSVLPTTDEVTGVTTYTGVYKILIENKGQGLMTDPSNYDKPCTASQKKENILKTGNVRVTMPGKDLSCTPIENIKDSNTYFTVCNAELGEISDSYTTPLSIIIDYGYLSPEIEKTVFVKKVAQNLVCPHDKCKDGSIGCSLYGGENAAAAGTCAQGQACCYESLEKCRRDFGYLGFDCRKENACNPQTILINYCPAPSDVCCQAAG